MGTNVIVTEYGRPASVALAHEVAQAKAPGALEPVTVIVPSNFAGLVARRLLGSAQLGGRGIANVNFVTPFRLAELLSVGQLGGRRPLTNPVLHAAVRRVLRDDPRQFRAVRDHYATERALAAAVGELGNVSTAAREKIRAHGANAAAMIDLYDSISERLRGFHDEADVARAASRRNDLADAIEPFGPLIWYLPGPITAPMARFLKAAFSATTASVIVATVGDQAIDHEVSRAMRIAGIDLPETAATTLPVADHVISVTDADEEVRAVIREIVQLVDTGIRLDRIGVFHPVPDPYVRILEQQLSAADIPANGPSRRRLSETIAGRVLLAALALPSERWRRDRVVALVNSGPTRHGAGPTRPAVWDALSRDAGVVTGLGDWRAKLQTELGRIDSTLADGTTSPTRHERAQSRRADVEELAAFVEGLAESVGAVESSESWKGRSRAAAELLRGLLGAPSARLWWTEDETDAFEQVEAALERLSLLDDLDPEPTMAVFVRALANELSIARGRTSRFGNGVVYGPLTSAPGHDLDAVFILGCAENLCPAPRREDVLLSDRVRGLAGGDLPLRLGQIDEQHRLFLAALSSAPAGHRWLMFPRGDLRSSRRSRPSRWLLPTASRLAGFSVYATDFDADSIPGVFQIPSHAQALLTATHYTSVEERDVAHVHAYVEGGGEASSHPVSGLVDRGLRAQLARRSPHFTAFDGNIAGFSGLARDEVMSASRLETWATCGFRYFLGYVLGLAERDDPERTIELSALDRGSAMHDVLDIFMREQTASAPPDPDQPWSPMQRRRAQQIAVEVFSDYERRGRTGRPIEWQTQKEDLLALIDDFLTHDDGFRFTHRVTPEHFELPFGVGDHPPLELELGGDRVLRFRGMIDRVDVDAEGRRIVSDYKTGSGRPFRGLENEPDPTRSGTLLQLGLYAEAVGARLGRSAERTDYWMVNPVAGFARHGYEWSPSHRHRLLTVLELIVDGIESGVFPVAPGEWQSFRNTYENCAYCEFTTVCPRDRAEHADDKADAPELEVRVALTQRSEAPGS